MSPAEHYAEAERLLALADEMRHTANQRLLDEWAPGLTPIWAQRTAGRERVAATAHVHATLATVNPGVLWPLRGVEAKPAEPQEPHARQRAAVNWPPCEACDHPASRHDLASDAPPKGGWDELVEPCEVGGCTCLGYLGDDPEADR